MEELRPLLSGLFTVSTVKYPDREKSTIVRDDDWIMTSSNGQNRMMVHLDYAKPINIDGIQVLSKKKIRFGPEGELILSLVSQQLKDFFILCARAQIQSIDSLEWVWRDGRGEIAVATMSYSDGIWTMELV